MYAMSAEIMRDAYCPTETYVALMTTEKHQKGDLELIAQDATRPTRTLPRYPDLQELKIPWASRKQVDTPSN